MTGYDETERFTRQDYDRLPEGFPAELLDGLLVRQPAPSWGRQRILNRILDRLNRLLGPDRTSPAPIEVGLDEWTVLQPELAVLDEADARRPAVDRIPLPLLVVEILSPETAEMDRTAKAPAYLAAGVREVWLVDPDARTIEIRTAAGARTFEGGTPAASEVVPGLAFSIDEMMR